MLQAQLPNECAGNKVRYGVASPVSGSIYQWKINGTGTILNNYNDSVDIQWGNDPDYVVLSIYEQTALGCIGEVTKSLIHIIGSNNYSIGVDKDACQNDTFSFEINPTSGLASMKWNNDNSLSGTDYLGIAKAKTDTITFEGITNSGCKVYDTALLKGHPLPVFTISDDGKVFKDTMMCGDQVLNLVAASNNVLIDYTWTTSEKNNIPESGSNFRHDAISPTYPLGTVKVFVTAINEFGCTSKDSVGLIRCIPPSLKNIPNAFSPNGDNVNETWVIKELEFYPEATVDVYDRWGRIVYHAENGYNKPWDGKANGSPLPMDNYFYIIRLDSKSKPIVGNIMIIK